jgi:hypothetical protein
MNPGEDRLIENRLIFKNSTFGGLYSRKRARLIWY